MTDAQRVSATTLTNAPSVQVTQEVLMHVIPDITAPLPPAFVDKIAQLLPNQRLVATGKLATQLDSVKESLALLTALTEAQAVPVAQPNLSSTPLVVLNNSVKVV
jgi:hypothetical protein